MSVYLEDLKNRSIAILKEMKRTGTWKSEMTKELFKLNNELGFTYETNYGCGECVKRVYERLVNHFQTNGIEI